MQAQANTHHVSSTLKAEDDVEQFLIDAAESGTVKIPLKLQARFPGSSDRLFSHDVS